MDQVIYKYRLEVDDHQKIQMPKGAKILTVQTQFGNPCLWAIVDPRQPEVSRCINMAGTGHDLSNRLMGIHIGTFQMAEGSLVFHVFDGGEYAA